MGPDGWCYQAITRVGGINWFDAEAACVATGAPHAHMAAIGYGTQKTVVQTNRCNGLIPATSVADGGKDYSIWIGLQDQGREGSYLHINGVSSSYVLSASGIPWGSGEFRCCGQHAFRCFADCS